MDALQTAIIVFAVSGPAAIIAGVGRTLLCLGRSFRSKRRLPAIIAGMTILALFALLGGIVVVWFGYGVAHTGKDAQTDLIVLAGTVLPSYIVSALAWYLARRLERPPQGDAP